MTGEWRKRRDSSQAGYALVNRNIGDYNGDGKSDIEWQDTSGDVAVWEMNGTRVVASSLVGFANPS